MTHNFASIHELMENPTIKSQRHEIKILLCKTKNGYNEIMRLGTDRVIKRENLTTR